MLSGSNSTRTSLTTREALERAARILDRPVESIAAMTASDVRALVAALVERYAPSTARLTLALVRGELERLEGIAAPATIRALAEARVSGRREAPAGREITAAERAALAAAAAQHPNAAIAARDVALLAFARATGLRASEICALDVGDVDLERKLVRLVAKGRVSREVPLAARAAAAIASWVAVRGLEAGPLFPSVRADGSPRGRMTRQGLHAWLAVLCERAGVAACSPHDFRRTLAGDVITASDLATAQKMLGHSRPATTARYDRRPVERLRSALDTLD
jgi:integrase